MVNWQQGNDSAALLIDLSPAINSSGAFHLLEEFIQQLPEDLSGLVIDLNAGDLLLTRGVMTRIKQFVTLKGAHLGILYATLPQTQQAALYEGLFVREKPGNAHYARIRQSLPSNIPGVLKMLSSASLPGASPSGAARSGSYASRPVGSPASGGGGVDLPMFNAQGNGASHTISPTIEYTPSQVSASAEVDSRRSDFRPADFRSVDFTPVSPQMRGKMSELSAPILEPAPASPEDSQEPSMTLDVFASAVSGDASANSAIIGDLKSDGDLKEVDYNEAALQTLYWRQNLRSGQTVRFPGNIIVVGDVHAGSEITAGGDIMVWGELRGVAHAGAQGNYKAEIRAMRIEALQLRIADYIARRPDRIYYHKDGAEAAISPELARVSDGEIKIFKTRPGRI